MPSEQKEGALASLSVNANAPPANKAENSASVKSVKGFSLVPSAFLSRSKRSKCSGLGIHPFQCSRSSNRLGSIRPERAG
jgi:hypothetical protein